MIIEEAHKKYCPLSIPGSTIGVGLFINEIRPCLSDDCMAWEEDDPDDKGMLCGHCRIFGVQ